MRSPLCARNAGIAFACGAMAELRDARDPLCTFALPGVVSIDPCEQALTKTAAVAMSATRSSRVEELIINKPLKCKVACERLAALSTSAVVDKFPATFVAGVDKEGPEQLLRPFAWLTLRSHDVELQRSGIDVVETR